MVDLARAAETLVLTALGAADERALRVGVTAVLHAFESASPASTKAALRHLGEGASRATGRGALVIHLALGALVEEGAPPEQAWPAVAGDLVDTLKRSTRFARACLKSTPGAKSLEEAFEFAGAVTAARLPKDARAWNLLSARSLAAVACLTRSARLRKAARASGDLLEAALPLDDLVDEVGFLSRALRVVDDEDILFIHPASARGYRLTAREIASNVELFVLLADVVVGEAKKGLLPGKPPDPRAVLAVKNRTPEARRAPSARLLLEPLAWNALRRDGTLPEGDDAAPHAIDLAGLPADIPRFGDKRVVLLRDARKPAIVPAEVAFPALHPELRLRAKLTRKEVERLLTAMARKNGAAKASSSRRRSKQ